MSRRLVADTTIERAILLKIGVEASPRNVKILRGEPMTIATAQTSAELFEAVAHGEKLLARMQQQREKLAAAADEADGKHAAAAASHARGQATPRELEAAKREREKAREAVEDCEQAIKGQQEDLATLKARSEAMQRDEAVAKIEQTRKKVTERVKEFWARWAELEAMVFETDQEGHRVNGLAHKHRVQEVRALELWEEHREKWLRSLDREPALLVRVR